MANGNGRLLEVFGVLEKVILINDTDSTAYDELATQYEELVQVICDDHVNAARVHIRDPNICSGLTKDIKKECTHILDFRLAAEKWRLDIDSRSKDRIVSFGEKLSCRFVAALLEDRVCLLGEKTGDLS